MINLSTPSEELMKELFDEKPKALYWHDKQTGSKSKTNELRERYAKEKETLGKRFIGFSTEYKSQRGNRWYVFDIVNVSDKAFHIATVSFIYYETYESIGCFMPAKQGGLETGQPEWGVDIFTSHFFQRYCERMGIPFRSRKMLETFAQNIIYMIGIDEVDKDGDEQEAYRIPHQGVIKARRRKDCPLVIEMRTFLSDAMLSRSKSKDYADMKEVADSKWYEAGSMLANFIRTFVKENENKDEKDMDINMNLAAAGYSGNQASQIMALLLNAVRGYSETEIKTLLRGTSLALSVLTAAYEKSNNIPDGSLRCKVMQWIADKDFGVANNNESEKADSPRIIIIDEEQLRADVEEMASLYPNEHWTMEQIRERLASDHAENMFFEGIGFGDSVSRENPDRCFWYDVVCIEPTVRVFKYNGCYKG